MSRSETIATADRSAYIARFIWGTRSNIDSFPYAPRLDPLKSILAKLEPPTPLPEPLPPLKAARGRASDEGGGDADVQNFLIADW